jgi:hypothetical protein
MQYLDAFEDAGGTVIRLDGGREAKRWLGELTKEKSGG